MQTLKKSILDHTIRVTEPKKVKLTREIPEWETWTGRHVEPGKFILDKAPHTVMRPGDRWAVGYDDTRWFKASVTVPDGMKGDKLYLVLSFGGEAIVRIDGKIIGSVSEHGDSEWLYRDEIPLTDSAEPGHVYNIEVEAAVCCGHFCDEAMAGAKTHTYTLGGACLRTVDRGLESYIFDVSSISDALDSIDDPVIREKVYAAMDDSIHMLNFDFGNERLWASVPAAADFLHKELAKIGWTPQGEVIMAGHSHLDIAWLWTSRELVRKTARTFANNLRLMEIYPDFKFTQSQAIVYWFMKEYYPEIYEQVKRRVKEGRWETVGGAWVEADTNIASGESLIRQLLYGYNFFMKEFGVRSETYWLPDCFGFSWALPQIIARSGMKYFITSKLGNNDTNQFPDSVFRWRAHSGDEITAYMQRVGYESGNFPDEVKQAWDTNAQRAVTGNSLGMFGYGDGGGGCTYAMIERGKRTNMIPGMPKYRNGYTTEFFEGLADKTGKLPLWDGEMYYENHRGTYTSQAFIKKNNRRGEFTMRRLEMLSVIAGKLSGRDYPADRIDEMWLILLKNQFHDTLPGTSIHEAVEMTRDEYRQLFALTDKLGRETDACLLGSEDVNAGTVTVCNSLNWNVSGAAVCEISDRFNGICDENGRALPSVNFVKDGKKYLLFEAPDIPAVGLRRFALSSSAFSGKKVSASVTRLENSKLKVKLDKNGLITSVYDKENEREVLSGKGNLLQIFGDKPVHESAWNLELDYQKRGWDLDRADSVEVVESSAMRGAVRIVRHFNASTITQDIVLAKDSTKIDFVTTVDWHETEKVLKAAFPVTVRAVSASYEIAHGAIDRPTHWNTSYDLAKFEVCGHKWADLSEGGYGVSLLNDCKYGYDIKDNVMRITLMRAPNCPDPVGDHGINTFTYSLYPHRGGWRDAGTVRLGFELNEPLYASVRSGNGAPEGRSFISTSGTPVILDAVKAACDGRGVIVRMYEPETRRGRVGVKFAFPVNKVTECNLMENDEKPVANEADGFSFDITPHQVRTFRVE